MGAKLSDEYFIIGNNCGVAWAYQDYHIQHDSHFAWTYFLPKDFISFAQEFNDIDWEHQDYTPKVMTKAEKDEMFCRAPFTRHPENNKYAYLTYTSPTRTYNQLLPHINVDSQEELATHYRRVERFLETIKNKKPFFLLMRDAVPPPAGVLTQEEQDAFTSMPNTILIWNEHSIVIGNGHETMRRLGYWRLIERGIIITERNER